MADRDQRQLERVRDALRSSLTALETGEDRLPRTFSCDLPNNIDHRGLLTRAIAKASGELSKAIDLVYNALEIGM